MLKRKQAELWQSQPKTQLALSATWTMNPSFHYH